LKTHGCELCETGRSKIKKLSRKALMLTKILTRFRYIYLCFCLILLEIPVATGAPQAAGGDNPNPGQSAADSLTSNAVNGFQPGFIGSIGNGAHPFPRLWRPYVEQPLPNMVLENSPRLHTLIHNGKLELSLSDALSLALENDLDIVIQRYIIPFAETDILRTKSGQAARGFTGALSPGELNSGAIGAGVSSAGGTGGTGNAGGITGGGGAVSIGAAGAFDPSVSYTFSYDRVTSPLNSLVVSGIPTTTSSAIANSASYAQLFTEGTSYSVSLSTLSQVTTQKNTLYNPDVTSRLSIGVNQPLLAGFGFMPNERFIIVARNNQKTAREVFLQQVITSIVQVENAYYDLASYQLNVQVTAKSLAAVNELLEETKRQQELGTLAHLDVVTAESQVAASRRDLIVAQTNLQIQETTLKQLLSKRGDSELDAATIVLTDALPEPRTQDLPDLATALSTASTKRSELREAGNNLDNQNIGIQYAKNNMLPSLAVFGLYAGSGLRGDTPVVTPAAPGTPVVTPVAPGTPMLTGGALGSLAQTFGATYPETAYGVSFGAAIRNRSAQADNVRSQLERNQLQVGLQTTRNQIKVQVQQARITLIQGKEQVAAAREATRLAQLSLDAERIKLRNGLSTAYNVVLKERDLVTAQYAELQATDAYAKALVAMDQAMGTTLDRNHIELNEALTGDVTERPSVPYRPSLDLPGVVR
jgi:outer membrane protein